MNPEKNISLMRQHLFSGGMKAVLWTDVFQSVLMFGSMIAIQIAGTIRVGGFGNVLRIAKEGGRLNLLKSVCFLLTFSLKFNLNILRAFSASSIVILKGWEIIGRSANVSLYQHSATHILIQDTFFCSFHFSSKQFQF